MMCVVVPGIGTVIMDYSPEVDLQLVSVVLMVVAAPPQYGRFVSQMPRKDGVPGATSVWMVLAPAELVL
jgi:hypothetical protein